MNKNNRTVISIMVIIDLIIAYVIVTKTSGIFNLLYAYFLLRQYQFMITAYDHETDRVYYTYQMSDAEILSGYVALVLSGLVSVYASISTNNIIVLIPNVIFTTLFSMVTGRKIWFMFNRIKIDKDNK